MRALGTNSRLIEEFILFLCKPHELEAFGTAAHLRCHVVPRTLRVIIGVQLGANLV